LLAYNTGNDMMINNMWNGYLDADAQFQGNGKLQAKRINVSVTNV
jgi:hypothetical protein